MNSTVELYGEKSEDSIKKQSISQGDLVLFTHFDDCFLGDNALIIYHHLWFRTERAVILWFNELCPNIDIATCCS